MGKLIKLIAVVAIVGICGCNEKPNAVLAPSLQPDINPLHVATRAPDTMLQRSISASVIAPPPSSPPDKTHTLSWSVDFPTNNILYILCTSSNLSTPKSNWNVLAVTSSKSAVVNETNIGWSGYFYVYSSNKVSGFTTFSSVNPP